MNPVDKRLAIQTEDHPIEYANFEGVIPESHYGSGTVMVWDKGYYQTDPEGSAAEPLARGEIKFTLDGKKLRGGFVLIRSALKSSGSGGRRSWLLIKTPGRVCWLALIDPKCPFCNDLGPRITLTSRDHRERSV